jgi:hypothetical protein
MRLGMFIVIDAEKVEIPNISDIEQGGVIVCTGDMIINNIKCNKGSLTEEERGKQILTLVSLGGKITLKGKDINASIIAIGDPSKNTDEDKDSIVKLSTKCEIYGNLVCGRIKPENFARKGGKVTYNPLLSPSEVNKNNYINNDNAYCINLIPAITYWEVKSE